jgi:hypothetical protein
MFGGELVVGVVGLHQVHDQKEGAIFGALIQPAAGGGGDEVGAFVFAAPGPQQGRDGQKRRAERPAPGVEDVAEAPAKAGVGAHPRVRRQQGGHVARLAQPLGDGGQSLAEAQGLIVAAVACGRAPGEHRGVGGQGPGRRAVGALKGHALGGQGAEPGRGGAAVAAGAGVVGPHGVEDHPQDVRRGGGRGVGDEGRDGDGPRDQQGRDGRGGEGGGEPRRAAAQGQEQGGEEQAQKHHAELNQDEGRPQRGHGAVAEAQAEQHEAGAARGTFTQEPAQDQPTQDQPAQGRGQQSPGDEARRQEALLQVALPPEAPQGQERHEGGAEGLADADGEPDAQALPQTRAQARRRSWGRREILRRRHRVALGWDRPRIMTRGHPC